MDYRFGPWRVAIRARELWLGDAMQPVARRVFECLTYLIEHRERAVGRDELVAALWGRVDVADVLVSQLIARARKAIGDDAQNQRAIRTIPGFGYRWVMPFDTAAPTPAPAESPSSSPLADITPLVSAAPQVVAAPDVAATLVAPPRSRTSAWLLALGLLVLALAGTAFWLQRRTTQTPIATHAAGNAVIVLPFEIAAARDAAWLRLGAMDLVGERLRAAGLAVPSSESVLVALHAQPVAGDDAAIATAAAALGANRVVRGRAEQSADGWRVELSALDADGARHVVSALRPLPTEAVRQAGDLLLAALGRSEGGANDTSENDALDERLQRAQAAILANEFDTARAILDQAEAADRNDPRLRYRLAQILFHGGQLGEADAILRDLLTDPDALPGNLRANVLVARGMLGMRRGDCANAQSAYAGATDLLEARGSALEQGNALAGRGLARACLRQFDVAANDLGLARARMTAAGDRLGLARVDNYLGLLDADRNRMADALVDFRNAAATFERVGAIDALRASLSGQLQVQIDLLQHADALATSDRLWVLRARVADVGQRLALDADRARALFGVGRLEAAAQVLSSAEADLAAPAQASYARDVHAERARLAASKGDTAQTLSEATQALADWPPRSDDTRRAETALILQRAQFAASPSQPAAASPHAATESPQGTIESPISGVAHAEMAVHRGDATTAEHLFVQSLAAAEAEGVPSSTALVAIAYARWLLGNQRASEAADVGGRVARWADRDFDCALLQAALYRALGRDDLRLVALHQAEALAGERPIPASLREPLASAPSR
jgi:DNA-binding winged helix-turn-helix (wHTH) protein/tetratricopeptide (TPR) repeat protein